MDLYLITGFLGAGKTTFLREFVRQFAGKRLRLIINEFGKAGVDGALLQDVNAVLAEDVYKRQGPLRESYPGAERW